MTRVNQSEIKLKTFFNKADVSEFPNDPGVFPFTRGIFQDMYQVKPWTIRQYSGFGSSEATNKRYLELIQQGQEGISVAFDLPTQMGLDPDNPKCEGEVGKVGVSVATFEEFERLFMGIPLDKISVSMTINATAPILVAFLIVLAKKRGHELEELRGTVQNDILKEFIARGTQIYDLDFSLRYSTDLSEFCIKNLPNFNWASISGYHIREAGATAVQELAFTFLNARVYFKALLERGLSIESILKRTSFFFDCMMDFFEEIAKFRAARDIYAHMVRDEYRCKDERCQKLKFHTQTGGSALTAQGYYNNIIRACIQCLAAVLGGTQSLHCSSFDEALGLPTEESALVALRTQQIIRYETGIPSVTDPLGGSFYVEYLTNEIKKKVRSLMSEIDNLGTLRCIKNGYIKKLIEDSAYKIQKRIEEKDQIIVGVNMFEEFSRPSDFFYVDDQETKDIISRLVNFKRTRNIQKVNVAREQLSNAKRSGNNLMEYIINAVENECTLGEITDALRQ